MTILFSENFEGGTNGSNVTSSNTSFPNVAPSGSITFSNAHVETGLGTLAAKAVASSNVPIMGPVGDNTALWTGSPTKIYWRFYFYCEVMTSATTALCHFKDSTHSAAMAAETPRLLTTGAVQMRNNALTQIAVSPTGLVSAGNFYRFEGMVDVTNAQQQMKVFAGANANGATADYDSGVVTSSMGTATIVDLLQIGFNNSTTATGHFDGIQVNDSAGGWVGSAVATSTGDVKVWNGTAFVAKPVKYWTGSAWVQKPAYKWNGSAWVPTTY